MINFSARTTVNNDQFLDPNECHVHIIRTKEYPLDIKILFYPYFMILIGSLFIEVGLLNVLHLWPSLVETNYILFMTQEVRMIIKHFCDIRGHMVLLFNHLDKRFILCIEYFIALDVLFKQDVNKHGELFVDYTNVVLEEEMKLVIT